MPLFDKPASTPNIIPAGYNDNFVNFRIGFKLV